METKYEGVAIRIDLGTTYSCVGVWHEQTNRVEIIYNDQGNKTTPSCVAFTNSQRLIGDAAKNQAASNPNNTVFGNLSFILLNILYINFLLSFHDDKQTYIVADAKRLIGRKYSESVIQNDILLWPFKVIAGTGDKPEVVVK
jgi:heat shock 70kDa protein 1/2/6/8